MSNAKLIVGPPGTGKTWWIGNKIKELVESGTKPNQILVASLTKAAAKEAAGRHDHIPEDNIGTIHSFCYHALDRPEIAESYKWIKEWNNIYPNWSLTPSYMGGFFDISSSKPGDILLNQINILRAKKQIDKIRNNDLKRFWNAWYEFKQDYHLLDFTDLIETAIHEVIYPPNHANIIFVDEAQDISMLEYQLLKSWSMWGSNIYFVGDKLQSLFTWRGATPEAVEWTKYEKFKLLNKSYRLPDVVKDYSLRFINRYFKEILEYKGSGKEGTVKKISASLNNLEQTLPIIDKAIKNSETVMLLASCSFMVNKIADFLKQRGYLYHNPYTNRWNSLSEKSIAFHFTFLVPKLFKHEWKLAQVKTLLLELKKCLKRGVKKKIKDGYEIDEQFVKDAFRNEEDYQAFIRQDERWFIEHGGNKDALNAVKNAIRKGGNLIPKIIIGTIHSVKGGQADNVILFPDLSQAGFDQTKIAGFYGLQAIAMLFYVGMTRAKKNLYLARPANSRYFNL